MRHRDFLGDMGTGGAPSLPVTPPEAMYEPVYGPPLSAAFQAKPALTAPKATPAPKSQNFLTKEAFGGLVWWQVIAGGLGIAAMGTGVIMLLKGK